VNAERQRVLRMLKEGRVTVEEAEALLDALADEGETAPGATTAGHEAGTPGAVGPGDQSGAPAGPAGDARGLLDDIRAAVDVDAIVESVRESLRRSSVDVDRVRDEVRRTAERVRDEAQKAAREYRRGWGADIARAIDGLWGMADAKGAWTHEADLPVGSTFALRNLWGDVAIRRSDDRRLRARATIRAWGRDAEEAAAVREAVQITVSGEGGRHVVQVEPPAAGPRRRFRVDFQIEMPEGSPVNVEQARGDVDARGVGGALEVRVASGDVTARDVPGTARIETSRGDITVERGRSVDAKTAHGDVELVEVAEGATVSVMHGDVTLERVRGRVVAGSRHGDLTFRSPSGPVGLEMETTHGDIHAEVRDLIPGTVSRLSAVHGNVTVALGAGARCRIGARVTRGEIHTAGPLRDAARQPRALRGVAGAPEADLEATTVSGDITIRIEPAEVSSSTPVGG
jgi:hypothetical protein